MSFISYDSQKLTPLKENNPSYQPSQEQIFSYAQQILSLNLPADQDLLYLAEQALKAPLPKDWQACEYFVNYSQEMSQNIIEDESVIVYRNKKTKQVIYDHPLDIFYKEKARQLKMLKNTAKYSQNVTPINQQLMQSSVIGMKKNSYKNQENQSNKSSIRMGGSSLQDSKTINNRYFPSKTSQLAKNITEESVIYSENTDEFQNLSMITDYHQLIDDQKSQKSKKKNMKIQQKGNKFKEDKIQNIAQINNNLLKLLKQKPKIIRPIIVPSQKQNQIKKLKQKQIKLIRQKQVKAAIQKMIFSSLLQVNEKKIKQMKQNLKNTINLKDVEQKILITKQFGDTESQSFEMKKLNEKQNELKRIQRQNKLMDEKIKQTIRLIELQKNLSYNPLIFNQLT